MAEHSWTQPEEGKFSHESASGDCGEGKPLDLAEERRCDVDGELVLSSITPGTSPLMVWVGCSRTRSRKSCSQQH